MNKPSAPASITPWYQPRLCVLVIEDYAVFVRAIKQTLKDHEIIVATNAEDALGLYQQHLPDITLLDINLPDCSGHDILRSLREIDPDAFIVMLTGSNLKEDVEQALSSGAQGYIIKPCTRKKLDDYIARYLEYREALEQKLITDSCKGADKLPQPARQAKFLIPYSVKEKQQIAEGSRRARLPELRILFVDDYVANQHTVAYKLQEYGYAPIDIASSGKEALEKIQEKDYQLVILDCELAETDGYFIANRIRHNDRLHQKYRIIIGLGAAPGGKEHVRWLQAGMNYYLQKPFPITRLHYFILDHLDEFLDEYTKE